MTLERKAVSGIGVRRDSVDLDRNGNALCDASVWLREQCSGGGVHERDGREVDLGRHSLASLADDRVALGVSRIDWVIDDASRLHVVGYERREKASLQRCIEAGPLVGMGRRRQGGHCDDGCKDAHGTERASVSVDAQGGLTL